MSTIFYKPKNKTQKQIMSKHKKYNPNKIPNRPTSFGTAVECIRWLKKSVYLIARGRTLNPEKPDEITWMTIGTGCVVAPNRMITASHVIDDKQSNDELKHHQPGDKYYLIKHDDEGNWHYRFFTPEVDKQLFLYPDVDLGIIYIEDEFYQSGDQVYASKEDFIRIDQKFRSVGTDVAVLGYPLCKLDFVGGDINQPKVGDILLRADAGIINCRYQTTANIYLYEFTIGFNPGNSGGPIFDFRTGQIISIVHGYRAIPINIREHILTDEEKKLITPKEYTGNAFIDVVHANYSVGFATPSFVGLFREHQIIK